MILEVKQGSVGELLFANSCRLSVLNKHQKNRKVFVFLQVSPIRSTLFSGLKVDLAKARQVKQGMMQELLIGGAACMTENQLTEWKASWRDEYLKWLCGFANAEGHYGSWISTEGVLNSTRRVSSTKRRFKKRAWRGSTSYPRPYASRIGSSYSTACCAKWSS